MNPIRVILAALGGFVAYFAVGAALFALVPSLINESRKYPSIFRDKDGQMSHMPVGMAATFLSILIVAVFYAQLYSGGSGLTQGAALGALIGLFVVALALVALYYARGLNWAGWEPNLVGGCLCGGALGNLLDRARLGYVVDFFDVHIGPHHWPYFNVADSLICLAVGWIVLRQLGGTKK